MQGVGPNTSVEQARANFWVDISQGVDRSPWGRLGVFCRSSMWYSYQMDLVLTGHDMALAMGLPTDSCPTMLLTDQKMRGLAGEAFHLANFMTVAWPYDMNPWAPWWKEDREEV